MLIRPKEGILDPQGKAVERALPALGFDGVCHVRVGRMVELEADGRRRPRPPLRAAARQPVVEDYEIDMPDTSSASRPGVSGSIEG